MVGTCEEDMKNQKKEVGSSRTDWTRNQTGMMFKYECTNGIIINSDENDVEVREKDKSKE